MNRNLPALAEILEDWRDLASDPDAADALLNLDAVRQQYARLRQHLDKLRSEPPQFDAIDLAAVLDDLASAQRAKNQIIEGNDLDVLVPTLRAFLFDDEESVDTKFSEYPARIRYAGHTILGELWGWTHLDQWPIFSQRALSGLRLLGWDVPGGNYPAFARAFHDLQDFYGKQEPVFPKLPLNLEIDQALAWVTRALDSKRPRPDPTTTDPAQTGASQTTAPSTEIPRYPMRPSHAIREFGAPYASAPTPPRAWRDQPLEKPSVEHLERAENAIRQQLALPTDTIRRATSHLLAGRHLVLTGAPGTGKSHLATLLASEIFGYYPMLVTATAEWSAFDVVGGLVPLAGEDGSLRYDVRPGVVYDALRRNWLLADDGTVRRNPTGEPLRVGATHDGHQWPGVWLIIDELNRADVDKAFGDLFTALESGQLRVPRAGTDASILIPLPRDFRIIATLNTRDRHFLFTLSDALKRRFAFLEIESPTGEAGERETILQRVSSSLEEAGFPNDRETLSEALDLLYPVVTLIRSLHPLGTAPMLAALRYVGVGCSLSTLPLDELLQESFIAEIVPQLEGMRDLPLRLLATLFREDREGALNLLADSLTRAYGDPVPLRVLRSVTHFLAPGMVEEVAALAAAPATEPTSTNQALDLLARLRPNQLRLPAPRWPRVAAQLEGWLENRG